MQAMIQYHTYRTSSAGAGGGGGEASAAPSANLFRRRLRFSPPPLAAATAFAGSPPSLPRLPPVESIPGTATRCSITCPRDKQQRGRIYSTPGTTVNDECGMTRIKWPLLISSSWCLNMFFIHEYRVVTCAIRKLHQCCRWRVGTACCLKLKSCCFSINASRAKQHRSRSRTRSGWVGQTHQQHKNKGQTRSCPVSSFPLSFTLVFNWAEPPLSKRRSLPV